MLRPSLLGILLVTLCVFAAGAEGIRTPGGNDIGPDTVTWILVGGPHTTHLENRKGGSSDKPVPNEAGVQLHASAATPTVINESLNPTTGATGEIANGPDCPHNHYHGFLLDNRDDGKACGWGQVVPFDNASDALGFASAAVMLEVRVGQEVLDGNPDFQAAHTDLAGAQEQLSGLSDALGQLQSSGKLSTLAANRAIRQVHTAEEADTSADGLVTDLQNGQNEEENQLALSKALKKGIQAKQRVIKTLFKKNLLTK